MKTRRHMPFSLSILPLAILFILLQTASCSTISYYGQAISGHLSLMHQRQDVSQLLDNPQTEPALASKLRLTENILRFAETDLMLDAHGSYRQLVITGQPAVSWNVVAAPEFSVEPKTWCFPVAGCVPYRGYFKQEKAQAFAEQLRSEGLDVDLSPVAAYSTLGWFDDPLLDTMLEYPPSQLAAVLIHELAHQKLYVEGDTAFNESFAEFVESLGVEQWLQQTSQADELRSWTLRRQAEPQFTRLLASTRESLASLYASSREPAELRREKQATLAALQQEYRLLVEQQWQGRDYFGGWLDGELNNARLALAATYTGGSCAFRGLYRQANGRLEDFYALAGQQARLSQPQRAAWLQAPCEQAR
jgi:predicted aminopeptidase